MRIRSVDEADRLNPAVPYPAQVPLVKMVAETGDRQLSGPYTKTILPEANLVEEVVASCYWVLDNGANVVPFDSAVHGMPFPTLSYGSSRTRKEHVYASGVSWQALVYDVTVDGERTQLPFVTDVWTTSSVTAANVEEKLEERLGSPFRCLSHGLMKRVDWLAGFAGCFYRPYDLRWLCHYPYATGPVRIEA